MEAIWSLALSRLFSSDHKNWLWRAFNLFFLWLKSSPVNIWLRTTIKGVVPISITLDFKMKVWHFEIKPLFMSKSKNNSGEWAWEGSREVGFVKTLFGTDHLLPWSRVGVHTLSCWFQCSVVNLRFHRCCFALGNCLSYVRLMVQGMSVTLVKFGIQSLVWTQFSIQEMYPWQLLSGQLSPRVDSWWLLSHSVSFLNSLKNSAFPHHYPFARQRE